MRCGQRNGDNGKPPTPAEAEGGGEPEDGSSGELDPYYLDKIYADLVRDCHLSYDQIARLTDRQIWALRHQTTHKDRQAEERTSWDNPVVAEAGAATFSQSLADAINRARAYHGLPPAATAGNHDG